MLVRGAVGSSALDRATYLSVDPVTLGFKELESQISHGSSYRDHMHMRASGDGSLIGMWCTSHSPNGIHVGTVENNRFAVKYDHESAGAILPSADGSFVCIRNGLISPDLKPLEETQIRGAFHVPAYQGPFYIRVLTEDADKSHRVQLRARGLANAIYSVEGLKLGGPDGWTRNFFTIDKRVHWVPRGNVLALIPESNQSVVIRRVDVEKELENIGAPYMFVMSSPKTKILKGRRFQYAVTCRSSAPITNFELSSGPEGMMLSEAGEVVWDVPRDYSADTVGVILKITNADSKTLYHTFNLKLVGDL
jgi:hypothetical protein